MTDTDTPTTRWRAPARQWPEPHDFGNAAVGAVQVAVGLSDHPSKTGRAVALNIRGEGGMSLTAVTIYDPDVLARLIADLTAAHAEMTTWTRKFQGGDLATIDAARAWDECGAFAGFDATGRTVRIVRPQYDPGADSDPGYWVVLADPAPGEPSTEQWVAADILTPIPATEGTP